MSRKRLRDGLAIGTMVVWALFWAVPMLWTIAVARLLFEPGMNIQAPPNLSPGSLQSLVEAGINDWGGVSPMPMRMPLVNGTPASPASRMVARRAAGALSGEP